MSQQQETKFPRGSEWRRWDLHIHASETKLSDCYGNDADVWDKYIDFLEKSPVAVFGITDYFSSESYFKLRNKYKEKYPNSKKVFFPNIELRISDAINANNGSPNIHIIFDNDEKVCPEEKIKKFLLELKTHTENAAGAKLSCSELFTKNDFEAASVTFDNLEKALTEVFAKTKPYLLFFPAKNDGIRGTDCNSPRKSLISDKLDGRCNGFFGGLGNRDHFLKTDRISGTISKPKPVVSCSDAHSFDDLQRLEGNTPEYPPTWIKADLTFRGLEQICHEPESRVCLDLIPPVLQRQQYEATKFISELRIEQASEYDEKNGTWFKNVQMPLNPELTVIIGNKGSGKSALADVIGLLGNSKQSDHFSFLSNKPNNKKFKQRGYAENFLGSLTWLGKQPITKKLSEDVDETKPETVRYLPQNFFEHLTNEIKIEAFRKEIEDVVYSHVDPTETMGKDNFSELQDFKTQQTKQETSALKTRLREINHEITTFEEQAEPIHKKQLAEKLIAKEAELTALADAIPFEEKPPEQETEEQKVHYEVLSKLLTQRSAVHEKEKKVVEQIAASKIRLQKILSIQQAINAFHESVVLHKEGLRSTCSEFGLNIDQIIQLTIEASEVEQLAKTTRHQITALEEHRKYKSFLEVEDFSAINSLLDLKAAAEYLEEKISAIKEKLGAEQRKYQSSLDSMAKWKEQYEKILGDSEAPETGTINGLKVQIKYIDENLSEDLNKRYEARKDIVKKIFASKMQVLRFYTDLKKSVEQKLNSVKTPDFSVEIKASNILDSNFYRDFLQYIKKNRKGAFNGSNEPEKVLKSLISEIDWNKFESIYSFLEAVIDALKGNSDQALRMQDQVSNIKDFYDFLFSLSYISPKYELRSGSKNLNELSPGEKGLLLLIFYLQLDKNNTPLVIDQPEDNLDNDSIFAVLANCIREAKKNRQVILVTHNPNLAIGADAEQVIHVKLDKSTKYKFSYETGSIENNRINDLIVLVLEGSQPAFIKRRLKYQII